MAHQDTIPILRQCSDLCDKKPVVIIDTREQQPLPISRFPIIRKGLYSGDYSVVGLETIFAVERKSVFDLVSCCVNSNRERFENELHRLRGYRFKRLLIIGGMDDIENGNYRSLIKPESVIGTLAAFEVRYEIPIVFCLTPVSGAAFVEKWVWYAVREQVNMINNMIRTIETMTPGGSNP